nr:MAG TPA: hypothetical protein [Caudoviricetes sp.]
MKVLPRLNVFSDGYQSNRTISNNIIRINTEKATKSHDITYFILVLLSTPESSLFFVKHRAYNILLR